jgi:hypothetical protein
MRVKTGTELESIDLQNDGKFKIKIAETEGLASKNVNSQSLLYRLSGFTRDRETHHSIE